MAFNGGDQISLGTSMIKKAALWFCILMLSACGGGSSAPIIEPVASNQVPAPVSEENPTSEVKVITQTIDGLLVDRPYLIRYPENSSEINYPVVFFFHDAGGNGEQWLSKNPDVSDLIDDGKFIGIFPDGYENEWNVGVETNVDDVEFVSLIVNELDTAGLFDVGKIFGVGSSNGAGLVNKIAKETTLFKAIAPLVGQQTEQNGAIVPSQSVSVFQVNGTEDSLVPVNGGSGPAGNIFMSAQGSAENWASNANCDMTATAQAKSWGDYPVQQYTFGSCSNGKRVRYSLVEGAGDGVDFGENVDLYGLIWRFFVSTDSSSPARNFKMLALGDSYTIGQSVCTICSFPEQLKASLKLEYAEKDSFTLQVIAETGWTTTNLKTAIITEDPLSDFDLVTLLIGVNNQYQNKAFSLYETEFVELVNSAISFVGGDTTKLIVVSIPDYAFTPFGQNFNPTEISAELELYNNFAQEYSEENALSYIYITDITQQGLETPALVASDGLHPSSLAYSKFVERILPIALEKLE